MNYDADRHAITIYQDRSALVKSTLPALFGLLAIVPIALYSRRRNSFTRIIALLSSFLLLSWESLFFSHILRLLIPQPVLVVTDKEIHYQPPAPWFVALELTILWEEIAAMYLNELTIHNKRQTATYRTLCIMPKDREAYFQRYRLLHPRRLPLLVIMAKTDSPFQISEPIVYPLSMDKLFTQIQTRFQEQIQAHQIEIREEHKITIG